MIDMRVKDLKNILIKLPDDMAVIIPVIDEGDANHIYGFRRARTAGILVSESEKDREVLCLNAAAEGQDIADQVHFSGRDVGVKKVLFGTSKYDALLDTSCVSYPFSSTYDTTYYTTPWRNSND